MTPYLLQIPTMFNNLLVLLGIDLSPVYCIMDGAFGNKNALHMVRQSSLHLISKLRYDAALYFPYDGQQKKARVKVPNSIITISPTNISKRQPHAMVSKPTSIKCPCGTNASPLNSIISLSSEPTSQRKKWLVSSYSVAIWVWRSINSSTITASASKSNSTSATPNNFEVSKIL
ncbi:MAG: transposase [Anaerolineae bacterium]|nr:transposase [Anaerolineae bacterium]